MAQTNTIDVIAIRDIASGKYLTCDEIEEAGALLRPYNEGEFIYLSEDCYTSQELDHIIHEAGKTGIWEVASAKVTITISDK